jgi:hypothetical protein
VNKLQESFPLEEQRSKEAAFLFSYAPLLLKREIVFLLP